MGDGLQTRRDIDAMAVGDRIVDGHFADIEPDTELDRFAVAPNGLVAKFSLDLNRELQRLVGSVEQGKNSIAGHVDDLAAIIADQRPEQLDRSGDLADAAGL